MTDTSEAEDAGLLGGDVEAGATDDVVKTTEAGDVEATPEEKAAAEKAAVEKAETEKSKDGTADKDTEKAPEKYEDFVVPDGMELDKGKVEAFTPLAQELGLNQERAQKLVDFFAEHVKTETEAQHEIWATEVKEWKTTAEADPEFGKDNFKASVAGGAAAIDTVMGDEAPAFKALLNSTQLGNHPEVIRFMYRVSKAIGEDKLHFGKSEEAPADAASAMYPTMKK